jgi:hypothetical protein
MLCPYVEPYTYTIGSPQQPISHSQIISIAQANPGSLWFIGNEMDRRDWNGGGQDEMLPALYATAYHDLYHLIKDVDPSAQIAIGGVIQPTPCRLAYLDVVWETYATLYGDHMPVDVWNIHNMILPEDQSWGAEMPPGVGVEDCEPTGYSIQDADDIEIFKQHIRGFRHWMRDKGEQDKPLIVSEYSVLHPVRDGFDFPRVTDYLYATFDYMTSATDSSLGDPDDDDRLVQRWAWYSLNDDGFEGYDSRHHLFGPDRKITDLGRAYGTYPWREVHLPVVYSNFGVFSSTPVRIRAIK